MNAEILSIGTELLLGNIVNTNATYLAEQLAQLGINVYHQSVVGDNEQRLNDALAVAFGRADLVITTGGLGPTYDDLTKETLAQFFNLPLVIDQASLKKIQDHFTQLSKTMATNNEKQALIPQGATVLANHCGTAPGIALQVMGQIAILLPGPPAEMRMMFEQEVIPFLTQFSQQTIVSRTIHLFGIGESTAEAMLREIMTQSTTPTIAPYAKEGEVTLRLTASAQTKEEGYALMEPAIAHIKHLFQPYIYGIDVDSLENALVDHCKTHNLTLATAESCTGGLISKRITDISGSSAVFLGGVCAYSNHLKMTALGVQAETLANYGAVSAETALEMAQGVLKLTGADFALSTTGVAGPGGGTTEKPVGLVYIAVVGHNYAKVEKLTMHENDTRWRIRDYATKKALHQALEATQSTHAFLQPKATKI